MGPMPEVFLRYLAWYLAQGRQALGKQWLLMVPDSALASRGLGVCSRQAYALGLICLLAVGVLIVCRAQC